MKMKIMMVLLSEIGNSQIISSLDGTVISFQFSGPIIMRISSDIRVESMLFRIGALEMK